MKFTTLASTALTVLMSGGLSTACERQETERAYFATLKQAADQGVVGEGRLLPPILPNASTSIEYAFNIDTNDTWITFDFRSQDFSEVTLKCGGQVADSYPTDSPQSPLENWPEWLTKDGVRSKPPAGWAVRHCSDGGFIAVNADGGTAAYWRKD